LRLQGSTNLLQNPKRDRAYVVTLNRSRLLKRNLALRSNHRDTFRQGLEQGSDVLPHRLARIPGRLKLRVQFAGEQVHRLGGPLGIPLALNHSFEDSQGVVQGHSNVTMPFRGRIDLEPAGQKPATGLVRIAFPLSRVRCQDFHGQMQFFIAGMIDF
jgi:hypothetical protein